MSECLLDKVERRYFHSIFEFDKTFLLAEII